MSCSVCRLPFTPFKTAQDPRPPPPGILSKAQDGYFQHAFGAFITNHGVLAKAYYVDANLFALDHTVMVDGPMVVMQTWETPSKLNEDDCDRSNFYAHTTCMWMLRVVFRAMGKSVEELTDLLEIQYILGRPLAGAQAGALPHVPYERVPPGVDVGAFWSATWELGRPKFDWEGYIQHGHGWTLSTPNVFPAFKPLTPERIASVGAPAPQPAAFTRLVLDVLLEVLPHLAARDYAARMGAAGLAFASADPGSAPAWAGPAPEQRGMDWLLYLSHVHRTQGMRARRWIFDTCRAVRAAVDAARPGSAFADECAPDGARRRSAARARLEKEVRFVKTWDLAERGGLDAVIRAMQAPENDEFGSEAGGSYTSVIARGVAEMERMDAELAQKNGTTVA